MARKGGKRAPPPPPPGKRKGNAKLLEVNEDEVNDDVDLCASPLPALLPNSELSASVRCSACRIPSCRLVANVVRSCGWTQQDCSRLGRCCWR